MSLCILYGLYTFLVVIFYIPYHFWAANMRKFLRGHPGLESRVEGSANPRLIYINILCTMYTIMVLVYTQYLELGSVIQMERGRSAPATAASTLYNAYSVSFLKGNH